MLIKLLWILLWLQLVILVSTRHQSFIETKIHFCGRAGKKFNIEVKMVKKVNVYKFSKKKFHTTFTVVINIFLNDVMLPAFSHFRLHQVGERFRTRALKFPGLISGCTMDWFQRWPKEALIAVADHFLSKYDIRCSEEVKRQVIQSMGIFHDGVSESCLEYFQRFVEKLFFSFKVSFTLNREILGKTFECKDLTLIFTKGFCQNFKLCLVHSILNDGRNINSQLNPW